MFENIFAFILMSEFPKYKRLFICLYYNFKTRATALAGFFWHTTSFFLNLLRWLQSMHGLITTAKETEVNVTRNKIIIRRRPLFCQVRTLCTLYIADEPNFQSMTKMAEKNEIRVLRT